MNTRAFTLALIISGLAMFMVYTYIEDQKSIIVGKYGRKVSVVVAKNDIKELELIDDSKISLKTVPQSFAQPGYFKSMRELDNTLALVPIIKGEQITKPRVSHPGAKTGLANQVSVGKRAIAFNVSPQASVAKLIKPGDRVDVLASVDYSKGGRPDTWKIQTILQDVLVLSTGKSLTNSLPIYGMKTPRSIKKMNANVYTNYNTVTLEVDSYQAQKLVHVITYNSKGKPFLVLRNNSDQDKVRIKPTDMYDILSEEDRAPARAYYQEKYKPRR